MKAKKERRKSSSASRQVREATKPVEATGGSLQHVADAKVSRRKLIEGSMAVVAVVGVASTGFGVSKKREQGSTGSSSSSTTSSTATYVTITPSQTNTATVPPSPPVVATDPMAVRTITLTVNGAKYNVNVEPRDMLVDVLREDLDLIATKRPCNRMSCGGCTVLIDGVPHESCTYMAVRGVGHSIVTAEIGTGDPVVNALQQAWVVADGGQCSYCGPGMIMAATALLKSNPSPTIPQIKAGLSGNICRCGNYMHIIAAVQAAATTLGGS